MSIRNLDLNLLRVFNEVMRERSLTRAASRLSMTQPAVSNAIGRLRDALGDELVRRSGYGVEPTERAAALWPVVRDTLANLEKAISPGEFDPRTAVETFRLAMADATASAIVPAMISLISEEAPGVSLRIVPLTTRDPRQLLDENKVHVAVGYFPVASAAIRLHSMQDDNADEYGTQAMYHGPYVCVMRKGHPLAGPKPMTLDEYCDAKHLLVSFSGRPFGFADQALAEIGRKRRIVLTVNQFFTAGQVVVKSDLLAVMPEHFLGATGFGGQLAACQAPFKMDVVSIDAVWRNDVDRDPGHRWLIGLLRRALAQVDDGGLVRSLK